MNWALCSELALCATSPPQSHVTLAPVLPISGDGEPTAIGQAVFRLPRKRTDVSVALFSGLCSGYFSVPTDVPRTFQIFQIDVCTCSAQATYLCLSIFYFYSSCSTC